MLLPGGILVGLLLKVVGYEIVIGCFLFLFITSISGVLSRAKRSNGAPCTMGKKIWLSVLRRNFGSDLQSHDLRPSVNPHHRHTIVK